MKKFIVNLRKLKMMKRKYYTKKFIFKALDLKNKVYINTLEEVYLVVIIKEEVTITIKFQ